MAYKETLAGRVRNLFRSGTDVEEKKMFGGLCYMVSGHMCCGILNDTLMARVGPDQYEACLKKDHVTEMDFTGKPMKGMVYVAQAGIADDADLAAWIHQCLDFINTLPPKNK